MRRPNSSTYFLLAGLASVTLGAAEAGATSAQTISSFETFFEAQYNEPFPGSASSTAYYNMQIGGEFAPHPYPSAWGTNPSFAQISSFWANPSTSQPYYAAATQGGQAYQLPYTSSPADPFLFYTTIPFN